MKKLTELLNSLTFGSAFTASYLRELADINLPEKATYKEFQQAQLLELQAAGFIRDKLLHQGMYLQRDGDHYRVLLPSENEEQVRRMNAAADRKYKRALLLQKNTPSQQSKRKHKDSVMSKLSHIKTSTRRGAVLA